MLTETAPEAAPQVAPVGNERPEPTANGSPHGGLAIHLLLVALTVASALDFHRVFRGGTWVFPILGTAVAVHLVCSLTRRVFRSPLPAVAVDLVALAVVVSWTVLPGSVTFGLPLAGTWRAVNRALTGLAASFDTASAPVHPSAGFLLLATTGVGTMALLAEWAAFRLDRRLAAAGPAFAIFVVGCILGTVRGRGWAVPLEVAVLGAYLVSERVEAQRDGGLWLGHRRQGATERVLRFGAAATAITVVVAFLAVEIAPASEGHGVLGWRSGSHTGERIIVSPIVSLSTRLISTSGTNVMTVRSPVPSYWQLTTLDMFTGGIWQSNGSYSSFHDQLPGAAAAVPAGARQVRESFHLQTLDSPWLPVAFTPVAVSGASGVQYDPGTASLLAPEATADGLSYTVTSLLYLATLDSAKLAAAPRLTPANAPAADLQLPGDVPAPVYSLANEIVRGDTTEYAKALALQNFFYEPEFTYTLRPPADGSGIGALSTFLFETHTGYCQQFAGAYAVLARAVGLPTRLAIGFTTGASTGPDSYQVTDADAHTWPEVWFPRYGWIPFEPTKGPSGAGFGIPGANAYTGDTSAAKNTAVTTPAPAAPTTTTTTPSTSPRIDTSPGAGLRAHSPGSKGGGSSSSAAAPTATTTPADPLGSGPIDTFGVLLLAAFALLAGNRLSRRQRWRRRRRLSGRARSGAPRAARILVAWEETVELVARRGPLPRPSETYREFARRAGAYLQPGLGDRRLSGDLVLAADLTAHACWIDGDVGADELAAAVAAAERIRTAIERQTTSAERLRLLVDPRLSWTGPKLATAAVGPDSVAPGAVGLGAMGRGAPGLSRRRGSGGAAGGSSRRQRR